ncbi:hypothetical protein [Nocardiopsis sp. FR26]|uniref:hypothetical protein n=1 Tax=Nocardiopsis sp. FR26 TaxID=2605987 RepID=UPI00135AE574|nr:hypothetical protein [Nocardiopsis sp. FR26]
MHGVRCEEANPGVEETTGRSLRDRAVAAALTIPIRLGPATIRNAQAGHTTTRLSGGEADDVVAAVAEVFLQAVADEPGIPDYAHEALARALRGDDD